VVTASRKWRAVTGGAFSVEAVRGPTGRLFAASEDRYLYAFSTVGRTLWRYDLRRPAVGLSVGADGIVLVEREDGTLLAVNPAGKAAWSRGGGAAGTADAMRRSDRSTAGVLSSASGLILRVERGSASREYREGYVLRALSPRGRPLWSRELEAAATVGPVAIAPAFGRRRFLLGDAAGNLIAYDESGTVLWRHRFDAPPTAVVETMHGQVLVGTAGGTVHKLRGSRSLGRFDLDGKAVRSIAGGGDGIFYALTEGDALHRLAGDAGGASTEGVAALCGLDDGPVVALTVGGRLLIVSPGSGEPEALATGITAVGRQGDNSGEPARARLTALGPNRIAIAAADWTLTVYELSGATRSPRAAGEDDGHPGTEGLPEGEDSEIDYIYFSRLLGSPRRKDQRHALSQIEQRIADGELAGSYTDVVELLLEFTGASGATSKRGGPAGTGLRPETGERAADLRERASAVRLLARIGGFGVRDALLRLARSSRERELRIAFLHAIPDMPVDADGRTAGAIRDVLRAEARTGADLRLGRAGIRAVRGYVSYRGAADSPAIVEAVSILAGGDFPRALAAEVGELTRSLY
jgi:hypothetical protein